MFAEYGKNVNKQYLIDKAILCKKSVVYVTHFADVDKGQWHAVTLVWSFKDANMINETGNTVFGFCFFITRGLQERQEKTA